MLRQGLIGSWLVLAGGLVGAPLPDSSAVARWPVLGVLRDHEAGRMLGLAVVLCGLGVLSTAWLRLCRECVSPGRGTSGIERARLAALVWSLPLVVAPPLFSRDGWSYAAQGVLAHRGLSPYDVGPSVLQGALVEAVDPRWLDTPTPYGPLPIVLGDLAATVTSEPWPLVVAHRAFALAGSVLLAWAVPRLASWAGANPALATAVAVASPFTLANGVAGLHNDLLMAGLMAAAVATAVERWWVWGAVLGGLAAAVKAPGGLVCIAVALLGLPPAATGAVRIARLVQVGVVATGTLVGLGTVWGLGVGWLAGLGVPSTVVTPLSLTALLGSGLDLVSEVLGLGTPPGLWRAFARGAGLALCFLVATAVAVRGRTGEPREAVRAMVVVVGAAVLLMPVVHPWYGLWALPFLAAGARSRLAVTALVAGCVVLGVIAPLDSSLHGAYVVIVGGVLTSGLVLASVLLTRRARLQLAGIAIG